MTEELLRKRFTLCGTNQWNFNRARERLNKWDWRSAVQRVLFRPFDFRFTIIDSDVVTNPRREIMRQFIKENIAILATRKSTEGFSVFVTSVPCGHKIVGNYDMTTVFPLYINELNSSIDLNGNEKHLNLSNKLLTKICQIFKISDGQLEKIGIHPIDIISYLYALFHSPSYRDRFSKQLKNDFPRVLLTSDLSFFKLLSSLGSKLVSMHSLEFNNNFKIDADLVFSQNLVRPNSNLVFEIEKISWSLNTVWLDKDRSKGFQGVSQEVWNFQIGGYQICEKWLKDRKGRILSEDEVVHYQRIILALSETIRLMKEIDAVIQQYGGWPGAFESGNSKVG
jgi:predicted helicase